MRKVDRLSDWNDGATRIREKVLRVDPEDNDISIFRVESPDELARVAVAMNGNRISLTQEIYLVAFSEDDVAGLRVERNAGATRCTWANSVHYDILLAGDDARRDVLIARALSANRRAKRFNKNALKQAVDAASSDGCFAAVENSLRCSFPIVCADAVRPSQLDTSK